MPGTVEGDVTLLLKAWGEGDEKAFEQLCPLVYQELRRLARGHMRRERSEHTLQATALVHEAFLRLTGQNKMAWESRGHFLAIAAQMMRRVLVDYARRRLGQKRGGQDVQVSIDDAPDIAKQLVPDVLTVSDALDSLAATDPRKAKIVELRYFGGLRIDETARVLGISPGTVMREWTLAKAWLYKEIRG